MTPALRAALAEALDNRTPVATVTRLADGAQSLLDMKDLEGDLSLDAEALTTARTMLSCGESGPLADDTLFVRSYPPPPRLFLVGAVHIAQALAPMAALAGYGVTVIDPRGAFATEDRFPGVALSTAWPDEALSAANLDVGSAVVALTHDPKLDDPALAVALRAEAFYLGALGSKKTHAARLERLRDHGFDDSALARIHGPVGLNLGGRTPPAIAVAVLAQMTQVRYGAAT